jgi:hypothetical protein
VDVAIGILVVSMEGLKLVTSENVNKGAQGAGHKAQGELRNQFFALCQVP